MIILEENFKWHLEAFASELFKYSLKKRYVTIFLFCFEDVWIFLLTTFILQLKKYISPWLKA